MTTWLSTCSLTNTSLVLTKRVFSISHQEVCRVSNFSIFLQTLIPLITSFTPNLSTDCKSCPFFYWQHSHLGISRIFLLAFSPCIIFKQLANLNTVRRWTSHQRWAHAHAWNKSTDSGWQLTDDTGNFISLTYSTVQTSQPSYQLFTVKPTNSTGSSSTLTLLRPSVTSSLKCANCSIQTSEAAPPLLKKLLLLLRHISYPSSELTKTSPPDISPQPFHSILKRLLFHKSYPNTSCSPPSSFRLYRHPS